MVSVKTGYDAAAYDRQYDALILTELDLCRRDLGFYQQILVSSYCE